MRIADVSHIVSLSQGKVFPKSHALADWLIRTLAAMLPSSFNIYFIFQKKQDNLGKPSFKK